MSEMMLLDAMIVAGVFAVNKPSKQKETQVWKDAIVNLCKRNFKYKEIIIRVPTPVCYELMCWNQAWKEFVTKEKSELFLYHKYSITNTILKRASEYSCEVGSVYDENKHKVSTIDPIIAAYCLNFGCCLLTANESDFPKPLFKAIDTEIILLQRKNSHLFKRQTIYLLKANI